MELLNIEVLCHETEFISIKKHDHFHRNAVTLLLTEITVCSELCKHVHTQVV